MSNFFQLLKISLLKSFKSPKKNNRLSESIMFTIFFLTGYIALLFGFFYGTKFIFDNSPSDFDGSIVLSLMMFVGVCFCLVTNVYRGSDVIFSSSDYGVLMSLPIDKKTLVASKVTSLYLFNLDVTITIMIPSLIAYGITYNPDFSFYLLFFLTALFIPMLPLFISSIISIIILYISKKSHYKNIIQILFILIAFFSILALVLYIASNVENINADFFIETFNFFSNYTNLFSSSIKGSFIDFSIFFSINVISLVALVLVISFKYKSIQDVVMTHHNDLKKVISYHEDKNNLLSLYKKELISFIKKPSYFLNTSINIILITFIATMSLFHLSIIDKAMDYVLLILPYAISAFIGLSTTTGCSISLEGKTFPLIRSLPIKMKDVFLSKILVNLTLTIPLTLITGLFFNIAFEGSVLFRIMLFVIPLVYTIFSSVIGLFIGISYANFDWKNMVTVIKQSKEAFYSMTVGVIFPIISIVIIFAFSIQNHDLALIINFVFYVIITILAIILLIKKGKKRYLAL